MLFASFLLKIFFKKPMKSPFNKLYSPFLSLLIYNFVISHKLKKNLYKFLIT